VEKAQDNAIKIARFLENHPKVAWVNYPGLKSHPRATPSMIWQKIK